MEEEKQEMVKQVEDDEEGKLCLMYWNFRGLAEPIRTLMEYLELPYKETKLSLGPAPLFSAATWEEKKGSLGTSFPNLPNLKDGDFILSESMAIMRYLCKKHAPDMVGKTLLDESQVDMVQHMMYDLKMKVTLPTYTPDWEKNKFAVRKYVKQRLHYIHDFLNDKPFLLGYLTYLDFFFCELLEFIMKALDSELIKQFPSFLTLLQRFLQITQIQKYRQSSKFANAGKFNNVSAFLEI
jgi:glutathione S-transferase